jgi:hypothetical protein
LTEQDPNERALQSLKPLFDELAAVGFDVSDLYRLPREKADVARYGPVLVKWLPLADEPRAKVWIVHALSTPFTDAAAVDVLIHEFEAADRFPEKTRHDLRYTIGSALERMGRAVPVERMAYLLSVPEWRPSLQLVAMALGRAARRKQTAAAAVSALPAVLEDPTVGRYAVDGLASGRLAISADAASELRPLVGRYLDDDVAWGRKSAKRALAKLDDCE